MASKSTIDLINNSLILLGCNTITDLTEGSEESTASNLIFDNIRQSCLRLHPWNFALLDIELPMVTDGSDVKHKYRFNLPADCLRIVTVYDDPDYKVKQRSIYTNRDSCKIRYIYDNTDISSWDASFYQVVVHKLATSLAYPLTKSTSLMDAMNNLFTRHLLSARAIDGSEDVMDELAPFDSPFIVGRF